MKIRLPVITFLMLIVTLAARYTIAAPGDFDHFETGYPLSGMHEQVPCDGCHGKGVFKGTPQRCAGCHNGQVAPGKSMRHVRSSNVCDDCHSPLAWEAATFDHGIAAGLCSGCHNGVTATGQPGRHIQTSQDCEECHFTHAWLPANFNHDDVLGSCRRCHPLPPGHTQTPADCDQCHITSSWTTVSVDHGSAAGICNTCHNNVLAEGKPNDHITTTQQCDQCHTTNAWSPVTFDHANLTAAQRDNCGSCHGIQFAKATHEKVKDTAIVYTITELRDCLGACHLYADTGLTVIEELRNGRHSITNW